VPPEPATGSTGCGWAAEAVDAVDEEVREREGDWPPQPASASAIERTAALAGVAARTSPSMPGCPRALGQSSNRPAYSANHPPCASCATPIRLPSPISIEGITTVPPSSEILAIEVSRSSVPK
jgi:hypothetical protein